MIEKQPSRSESQEKSPDGIFRVIIIGPACSGKSTLLRTFRDTGYTVRHEPDNPVLQLFLENPKKYAYRNQLHKTIQLMEIEVLDSKGIGLTNPHFQESGVLATAVYNRYLFDQGYMTGEQFNHLNWLYQHHLDSFPTPDLVVYLHADESVIKTRAVKRDGLVAHDPQSLQPYWDKLIRDVEARGIPVFKVNTGEHEVHETKSMIMGEIKHLKELREDKDRPVRTIEFQNPALTPAPPKKRPMYTPE